MVEAVYGVGQTSYPLVLGSTPCTRCHGAGTFIAHPNQGTGTICFKCHGRRVNLTPAARRAWAALPNVDAAIAGDLVYVMADLCRVEGIRWIPLGTYRDCRACKVYANLHVRVSLIDRAGSYSFFRLVCERVECHDLRDDGLPVAVAGVTWGRSCATEPWISERAIAPTEDVLGTEYQP